MSTRQKKTLFVSVLFIFLMTSFVSPVLAVDYTGQEKEETVLAPKYKVFLKEVQSIITDDEKEVFQGLKNNRERDIFIESFWKSRGGRRQGVRANINLLMLMQMVRVLDLSENQIVKIMPMMNKNEKEKQDLHREIMGHMRVLQIFIREDPPYTQEDREQYNSRLNGKLGILRKLRSALREKEIEFETFLSANLSPLQQARFFVFSQEFYRGLREKLDNARRTQQRSLQVRRKKR